MNILLVEDEKPLSDALCKILKKESLLVDAVYTGTDAFHLPFQFPDTPPACFRFPFVKCPFLRIINLEKLDIMAPG